LVVETNIAEDVAAPPVPDHAPAGETDHLASAVLRSLGRSYRNQFSLSPVRATLLGLLTLGVFPIFRLSAAFRNFVMFEKQQLGYLTDWLRLHAGGEEAAALADWTKAIDTGRRGSVVVRFCLVAVVLVLFATIDGRVTIDRLLNATYHFIHLDSHRAENNLVAFLVWNAGLSTIYLALWLRVLSHRAKMRGFIDRFNAIARRHGVESIRPPAAAIDTNPLWIIGALVMLWWGAIWSIPLMLAAATQRGYINSSSQQLRGQLMDRVRAMLMNRRPMVAVPNYMIHGKRCENGVCQATLPAGARYCPRCGSAVAQSRVA
jgi:hypothetical protein